MFVKTEQLAHLQHRLFVENGLPRTKLVFVNLAFRNWHHLVGDASTFALYTQTGFPTLRVDIRKDYLSIVTWILCVIKKQMFLHSLWNIVSEPEETKSNPCAYKTNNQGQNHSSGEKQITDNSGSSKGYVSLYKKQKDASFRPTEIPTASVHVHWRALS